MCNKRIKIKQKNTDQTRWQTAEMSVLFSPFATFQIEARCKVRWIRYFEKQRQKNFIRLKYVCFDIFQMFCIVWRTIITRIFSVVGLLAGLGTASQDTLGLMLNICFLLCHKCTSPHLLCWFPCLLGTCMCKSNIKLYHPSNHPSQWRIWAHR